MNPAGEKAQQSTTHQTLTIPWARPCWRSSRQGKMLQGAAGVHRCCGHPSPSRGSGSRTGVPALPVGAGAGPGSRGVSACPGTQPHPALANRPPYRRA